MRCFFACVAITATLAAGLTLPIAGARPAISAAAGGAIALLNLWAWKGVVSVLAQAAAGGARAGLGFFIVPKTLGLFGLVWLLLARHVVSAGPLAIGYAALPIGVAIGALVCDKAA
jgi:hypothetical protein